MRIAATIALGIIATSTLAAAAAPAAPPKELKLMHVSGTFDVKLAPQAADNPHAQDAGITRLGL
ncbi:MAG: hypothetical protein ACREUC_16165, partial [Steroidobacteraceae bacterium]